MAEWWENDPVVQEEQSQDWYLSDPVADEATVQDQPSAYGSQIFSGLLEGATGALGAPIDLVNNFVVAPAVSGINSLLGTNIQPSATPLGGSAGLRQGLAISPGTENSGEQFARRVSQSVGGAAVPLAGSAKTAGQVLSGLATATGGGIGGATAQHIAPGNVWLEIAGELLGGIGTGAAISSLADRAARKSAESAIPTIEQLKDEASDLYRAAEERGIVAAAEDTQVLSQRIKNIARQEELITPKGRISPEYPKAAEAVKLLEDYSGEVMNPRQMQVIRETLADARNSTQGKERRIASKFLSEFDSFTDPLAPELRRAREVSQKYLKAGQLETARELAGARAGQFTGSGFENALRTEYRALDRRIVKGQEQGWNPEQIQAIQNVSRGTPLSNTARNIGRMSPTGPVSFMATAGVPFMIGNAIGGPGLGTALGAGAAALGYGARGAATSMGIRNAEIAELLTRGGSLPVGGDQQIRRAIIEALIGSNLAVER